MVSEQHTPRLPLYLGCPVWNCDHWSGVVYPDKTHKRDWLNWYSRMFNTSEGNSSFYGIPTPEVTRRWAESAAEGFQFCMKFPREISHDRQLVGAEQPTGRFLAALEELAQTAHLGPSFLQLGPAFDAQQFPILEAYLRRLPADMPWAVEVRHLSWFDSADHERRLNDLLGELAMSRVLFDSRPLYQAPPSDDIERVSQTRKPKSPHRTSVTNTRPMLRLIGRNQIELVDAFLDEWVEVIVGWIQAGLEPFVFTHAPDDRFAPALARRLWDRLRPRLAQDLSPLPSPPVRPQQLGLFD